MGLASVGAWIAIAGVVSLESGGMAGPGLLWTACFHRIYARQDFASGRETGVRSVPSLMGLGPALWVSRATLVLSLTLLVALGLYSPALSALYYIAVALCGVLLLIEHSIVSPHDLSKITIA